LLDGKWRGLWRRYARAARLWPRICPVRGRCSHWTLPRADGLTRGARDQWEGGVMATGENIRTWFGNTWHDGDVMIMRAADHGSWLGTTVFDGARYFEGVAQTCWPIASGSTLGRGADDHAHRHGEDMAALIMDGLRGLCPGCRGLHPADVLGARRRRSGCRAEARRYRLLRSASNRSRWRRRNLDHADHHALPPPGAGGCVCNAKAGCLYPNNARMLVEAKSKGFGNALVADAMGNVAETATANVFMVRDGEVFTPIANGTFLSGITRARHIANLRADGVEVHETVLTFDDFRAGRRGVPVGQHEQGDAGDPRVRRTPTIRSARFGRDPPAPRESSTGTGRRRRRTRPSPDPLPVAGHLQGAPADQPGAEQRRRGHRVVKAIEREGIGRIGNDMGGKAPVAGEAGELRRVAKVLVTLGAIGTVAAGMAQPRNADASADVEAVHVGAERVDAADDLVARHDGQRAAGKLAIDDMKIGAADGAGLDPDADLARTGTGQGAVFPDERRADLVQDHRPHRVGRGGARVDL
jgi:branched-chain amino acid aminotransferase